MSYVHTVVLNELIECSMKHKLHHDTIVTRFTYHCKQLHNVGVLQNAHLCFLPQFLRYSANVTKITIRIAMLV